MSALATRTLVNFRVPVTSLKAFDDACHLLGSTRTRILNKLMTDFTTNAAVTLPQQLAEQRRVGKQLRTAVESANRKKWAIAREAAETAFKPRERLKFSEFHAASRLEEI